jgi:peptidoglycan/xylan/chitin deacetylase (PgdA/CDA1 family)
MLRPGPIILGYHRVARTEWDPQYLCVSPENFEAQIELLLERAAPLSLQALRRGMEDDSRPDKAFVITLDDGYQDSLEVAAPILEKHGVPATVFVTTGMIGKPFWWCEVQHLVESAPTLPAEIAVEFAGCRFRWIRKADGPRARARLIQSVGDFFRKLPFEIQDDALARVRAAFGTTSENHSGICAMSEEQVAALAASDHVEVGSHMVTHTSLNQLPDACQRSEMRDSRSVLERIIGKRVESFSYPNGRLNGLSLRLAAESGYSAGCTSREELVHSNCNPLRLPRIWAGDWSAQQFSRWLWRWRM